MCQLVGGYTRDPARPHEPHKVIYYRVSAVHKDHSGRRE